MADQCMLKQQWPLPTLELSQLYWAVCNNSQLPHWEANANAQVQQCTHWLYTIKNIIQELIYCNIDLVYCHIAQEVNCCCYSYYSLSVLKKCSCCKVFFYDSSSVDWPCVILFDIGTQKLKTGNHLPFLSFGV